MEDNNLLNNAEGADNPAGFGTQNFDDGQKKRSSSKKAVLIAAIVVFLLTTGVGCALIFAGDYISNTCRMLTMDEKEYYQWVVKKNIISKLSGSGSAGNRYESEQAENLCVNSDITIESDREFTDMIGIPELKKFGINARMSKDDYTYGIDLGVSYNAVKLLNLQSVLDMGVQQMYGKISPYSEDMVDASYIFKQSISDGKTIGDLAKEYIDEQETERNIDSLALADSIKNYALILLDIMDDVKLEKGITRMVGERELNYNVLTASADTGRVISALKEILQLLKTDDAVLNIFISQMMKKEDMLEALDKTIAELDRIDTAESATFITELYVDNKGNIIGGEFGLNNNSTDYEFDYIVNEDKSIYDMDAGIRVAGSEILSIESRGRKENGAYNGKIKIVPGAFIRAFLNGNASINIDINDMKSDAEGNYSGEYKLSVSCDKEVSDRLGLGELNISDYSIIFGTEKKDLEFSSRLALSNKDKDLISISQKTSIKRESWLPFNPDNEPIVYSGDNIDEYFDGQKVLGYLFDTLDKIDDKALNDFISAIIEEETGLEGLEYIREMYEGGAFGEQPDDYEETGEQGGDDFEDDDPDTGVETGQIISDDETMNKSLQEISDDKLFYHSGMQYADYVKVADYLGIGYDAEEDDRPKTLEEAKEELLSNYGSVVTREVTDRGALMGDYITMDIALVVFDKAIDEYSFKDCVAVLGNYDYGDGLDDSLIGMFPGESRTISVTLNELYGEFEGFTGDFKITLKSIEKSTEVGWNEEFIVDCLGYESMEACEEALRSKIISDEPDYDMIFSLLINDLIYATDISGIPDELYNSTGEQLISQLDEYCMTHNGMTLKQYIETGEDSYCDYDSFIDSYIQEAVYMRSFYGAVAKEQSIYVTGAEYKEFVSNLMDIFDYEAYEELLSHYICEEEIADYIIQEKVNDLIIQSAEPIER